MAQARRRMVPPLPAASRPSNSTTSRRPSCCSQRIRLFSSTCSGSSLAWYSLRFSGGFDFAELAEEAELLAVVVRAPAPAKAPALAHVHFAHRHGPSRGAQHPLADQGRLRVRAIHQRAGRSERAMETRAPQASRHAPIIGRMALPGLTWGVEAATGKLVWTFDPAEAAAGAPSRPVRSPSIRISSRRAR